MTAQVIKTFDYAIRAIEKDDVEIAKQAIQGEEEVDRMEKKYRKQHIERLERESCIPEAGVIYIDMMTSLERISDYADNIANYIIDENEK